MTRMIMTHIPPDAWSDIRALVREAPDAFMSFDMGDAWAVLRGDAALFQAIQGRYPMVRMRESMGGRATVQDLMGPISYGCW